MGKSTICDDICKKLNLKYLSASKLLKWGEINEDPLNKRVANIPDTQERLIKGIENTVTSQFNYLLDGHYCLLDKNSNIVKIPIDTFRAINPISLNIIVGHSAEIKRRLQQRDEKEYSIELIEKMQHIEFEHAEAISAILNVKLNIGTQSEYSEMITAIANRFNI